MNTARVAIAVAALTAATHLQALEIDPLVIPEINLGGRVIATANYGQAEGDGVSDDHKSIDFADSSFLVGFSKYLFNDRDYGYAIVGFKTTEDDSEIGDQWYPHQVFAGIGGPRFEVRLGRTQLPNTLVAFPTMRDDDLLEYRYVANGFSNAEAEEYQIFGGQVAGTWWITPALSFSASATARTGTDPAGDRTASEELNGGALTLAYSVPEAIKFDRGIRFAAVAVDQQRLGAFGIAPEDDMTSVIGGITYNLNSDPERPWGLDIQAIAGNGSQAVTLSEGYARARAKSRAAAAALRYAHRPNLQTRWQAAVTLGWKDYPDFDDAASIAVAPSYVYRLGSGIDFLAQYVYQKNDQGLAQAVGVETEHRVFAGVSVALLHTFNETVGERGDILNLEHGITDYGPAAGGH